MLLWVNVIAHTFFGRGNGAPDISQKAEVLWVPESFQVGASGSPTACHEDFGDDGVSVACVHILSLNQVTFNRKFIGTVLDSDVWKLWRVQIHVSFPGAMGRLCMHQEVVTFERPQTYSRYTLDDRFE